MKIKKAKEEAGSQGVVSKFPVKKNKLKIISK